MRQSELLPSLSLRNKLLLFAGALVLVPGFLLALIAERSGRDSLEQIIGRQLARDAGLPTALIRDAGHTEFGGVPTLTACAIGPARVEDIDPITGPEGAVATKPA